MSGWRVVQQTQAAFTDKANLPILDACLEELLAEAWRIRQAVFPTKIEFVSPAKTLPVSVTGDSCSLNCAHCGRVYLRNMVSIGQVLATSKGPENSYLVSGGCNDNGAVPLLEHMDEITELARRGRLNLHTGLLGDEEARELAAFAAAVSFDFVGDDNTIKNVYGLQAGVADYLASYRSLRRYARVVPHICIGLEGGRIRGEYRVLELLAAEEVEAISLIVFRPTRGTRYSACPPPPLEEVARLFAAARILFPQTPLFLGCMRPGGRYRQALDSIALKAGINKIVLPAPAARRQAEDLGLDITVSGECCSL